MQGRGTTHRGNRLLRATAWLQHPPRPAIRQEAGRSSQAVHPFREASICTNTCCSMALRSGTAPPCPRQWAGYANSAQDPPSTRALTQASGITQTRARPYTTLRQGTLTRLKTISAFRLPHLPSPGQPSLTTNVPCLLENGAVAIAAPLHPPGPSQQHCNCGGMLV